MSRQSRNSAAEAVPRVMLRFASVSQMVTTRRESGNGSGFSKIPLTTLKITIFAAMPIAKVRMATAAKPGFRGGRHSDFGDRHSREYRDFQRGQRNFAETAAVSGFAPGRHHLGDGREPQHYTRHRLGCGIPGLARHESRFPGAFRISRAVLRDYGQRRSRTGLGLASIRKLFPHVARHANNRPGLYTRR